MGRGKLIGVVFLLTTAILVAALPASAQKKQRTYTVHLSIKADAGRHLLRGIVVSGAPFEMCESAKVKIRQSLPGKDKTVAKVRPSDKEWRFAVPAGLRGDPVYAETAGYPVPGRGVRCLGAHSKTITAL
jgi:hypothetical protein